MAHVILKRSQVTYMDLDEFPMFIAMCQANNGIWMAAVNGKDKEHAICFFKEQYPDVEILAIEKISNLLKAVKSHEEVWDLVNNLHLDIEDL